MARKDKEHDRRLHNLMCVAVNMDLIFNREKCDVKTTSVTFFGTVYDKDGAHPDPKKVEAIHKMPPPEEPQELQKFLGMTTYLSSFIPSSQSSPHPCENCCRRIQSSPGMTPTKKPSALSSRWSARTPHFDTLTHGNQLLSRSMRHRRD